jgi:hypothetical protein
MGTIFIPRVTEADHEVLLNVVHEYPSYSYDKWLNFRAKEIAQWKAGGGEVIEIDVSPDDFSRYCRDTGARPDINAFRAIATAKGTGKFK